MSSGSNARPQLSDWITFLSSEKSTNLTNIIAVGAVALAAVGIIVTTGGLGGWWRNIALLSIWVVAQVLLRLLQTPLTKADRLLKRIMNNEFKELSDIEKEWNDC